MRPRYYKQRDQFRCGPLSVFNALKWAGDCDGLSVKKAMPRLAALCNCDRLTKGTHPELLGETLRSYGRGVFRVRWVLTPTLKEIEEHLRDGGAIIINFRWREMRKRKMVDARHYVLVTDISSSGEVFGVVNYRKTQPVYQRIHRHSFKKRILRFRQPPFAAWFLTRTSDEKSRAASAEG